jgi:hypothetical protein
MELSSSDFRRFKRRCRMAPVGRTEPDTISIKRSPEHAQLVLLYLDRVASRTSPVSAATPFPAIGGRKVIIYPARASECFSDTQVDGC